MMVCFCLRGKARPSKCYSLYFVSKGTTCRCELPSVQQPSQGEEEWEESDTPTDDPGDGVRPSFPDVVSRISEAIDSLGGRGVLPKLNWSAPRVCI